MQAGDGNAEISALLIWFRINFAVIWPRCEVCEVSRWGAYNSLRERFGAAPVAGVLLSRSGERAVK
jgi:hypothetical protein